MVKIINPESLSSEEAKSLLAFFEAESELGIRVWKKGKTFTFDNKTEFQFAQDVILRKRKDGKPGVRYEFISQKSLGSGGYSVVYQIAGTLALEPTTIHYKQAGYSDKARTVKVQKHSKSNPLKNVLKEYNLAKKSPSQGIKEPVFDGTTSYLVMRKFKGKELFDIIDADQSATKVLTLQQRIDLSQALLKALKEQVTDRGIIHRDIKGENIFVDLTPPIRVTIFDFGLATPSDAPEKKLVGTLGFIAPEVFDGLEPSVKTDVFSMGRVLALLWHVDLESYDYADPKQYKKNAKHIDLSTLFTELPEVGRKKRALIKNVLSRMMSADTSERLSIEQAIAEFDKLSSPKGLLPPFGVTGSLVRHSYEITSTRTGKGSYAFFTEISKKEADEGIIEDMTHLIDELTSARRVI